MTREEHTLEINALIKNEVSHNTWEKVRAVLEKSADYVDAKIALLNFLTEETDPAFQEWLATNPLSSFLTEETDPVFVAWLNTNPLAAVAPPLVFMTQLYQETTGNPNPNGGFDTLQLNPFDSSQALYRFVDFERIGAGEYTVKVAHKTASTVTDFNKIAIMFGDSAVRLASGYENGAAGPISWRMWTFKTHTPAGVLEDDQLTGAFCTITLYP